MSTVAPSVPLSVRLLQICDFFKLPYFLLAGIFSEANKHRSWRRTLNDSLGRFLTSRTWEVEAFVSLMGPTEQTYKGWARKNNLEILTDDVEVGGKLHWIGPRRYDRVLLHFHGGGFCLPVEEHKHLGFLLGVQQEFETRIGGVGVVLLNYSLSHESKFPTQLNQANAAIAHLISKGVSPSKLILSGDSAGGNLVLQVISHLLHPLPSALAPPTLTTPFAGAALISPWITFDSSIPSYARNEQKDILAGAAYSYLAGHFMASVPDSARTYAEPYTAHDAWWEGMSTVVTRMYASAGEVECTYDAIVDFFNGPIKAQLPNISFVIEKNGVHEDMLNSFGAGEGGQSAEYWLWVQWVSETFGSQ